MRYLRTFGFLLITALSFSTSSACSRQNSTGNPELSFWVVGGSEGVEARFGPGLMEAYSRNRSESNRVLFTLAEQPLQEAAILRRSGLPGRELQALLASLAAVRLIQQSDDGRWLTAVPVITDQRMKAIKEDLRPIALAVGNSVAGDVPQLMALYDEAKAASDPPWNDVAHLIIDKFIIDGAFHRAVGTLERESGVRIHYSQAQNYITAFFFERGEHFSSFGTNWYLFNEGDAQREVYILHGNLFRRYEIRMNRHRGDEKFSAALFKLSLDGGLGSLTNQETEMLERLGWLSGGQLAVPTVEASTIKALLPTADILGLRGAQVLFENHHVILDSFGNSPHSQFSAAAGDYIQVCYHIVFSSILEELVNAGVLPPMPDSIPEYLGAYIVLGKLY